MSDYRRPGVYLEERLQTQPTQSGSVTAVGVFAGIAPKGDAFTAVRVESWSDYVQKFGGFEPVPVTDGGTDATLLSYLPHAVFNYYQNGGRAAYIIRVVPSATNSQGATATVSVTDGATTPKTSFLVHANGPGEWGNDVDVTVIDQVVDDSGNQIFGIIVSIDGAPVERFNNLSMAGVQGTRPVLSAINDPLAGSQYITLTPPTGGVLINPKPQGWPLTGGVDPATPGTADLTGTAVTDAIRSIEGPQLVSFQPFRKQDGSFVFPTPAAFTTLNTDRNDIFVIWDGHPLAAAGANYVTDILSVASSVGMSDSYSAVYCPWIIVPDPSQAGATIAVPPSGSVQGMIARMDATIGPWRAPAGIPAVLSTAVSAEVKFTDTDQGQLNYKQVNVIRAVPGSGICVMGARTRKLYGPDRYVSARRNLIYIEDSLKLSTQFAVYENNDSRLWSALGHTAINLLRPLWERGGLAGATAAEAFYVVCDSTINTPQVIQSGEVRMEIGVALQYPAEFVVIRISQFDSGASVVTDVATAA